MYTIYIYNKKNTHLSKQKETKRNLKKGLYSILIDCPLIRSKNTLFFFMVKFYKFIRGLGWGWHTQGGAKPLSLLACKNFLNFWIVINENKILKIR